MKYICIKKEKAKKGRKSLCCMSAIQTELKDSRDMQAIYIYLYMCVWMKFYVFIINANIQTYI